MPWWRDHGRRNRVALVAFGSLALLGILYPAFTNYLFGGDRRVLVVTLEQNAGQDARDRIKAECGALPGIGVVPDRGDPDPAIQGRFPVRFQIGDTSAAQQAALEQCINDQPGVRGFLTQRG